MNTYKMIETLFPRTKNVDEVTFIIEKYGPKFGVNTDLRLAHFLAQVREELGDEFKPISENLNYSEEALPKIFSAFRNNNYANLYGRNAEHKANQRMIANIAYANRMGNSDIDSEDGWNYRGAGSLQITGKSNYLNVQNRIDKYYPNSYVDIYNEVGIHSLKGSILAGMGYWIWKDIYRDADKGISDSAVDACTAKINKHTDSYSHRRKHFNKIKHLIN